MTELRHRNGRFERLQAYLLDEELRSTLASSMIDRLTQIATGLSSEVIRATRGWSEEKLATLAACLEALGPFVEVGIYEWPTGDESEIVALQEFRALKPEEQADLAFLTPLMLTPQDAAEVSDLACVIHRMFRLYGRKTPRRI